MLRVPMGKEGCAGPTPASGLPSLPNRVGRKGGSLSRGRGAGRWQAGRGELDGDIGGIEGRGRSCLLAQTEGEVA